MVLVSATLIASVVTTQSKFKAMRAEEFDRTVMPLMAARAADILDDHGMGALSDFLASSIKHSRLASLSFRRRRGGNPVAANATRR